jgi:hypothetical protein
VVQTDLVLLAHLARVHEPLKGGKEGLRLRVGDAGRLQQRRRPLRRAHGLQEGALWHGAEHARACADAAQRGGQRMPADSADECHNGQTGVTEGALTARSRAVVCFSERDDNHTCWRS